MDPPTGNRLIVLKRKTIPAAPEALRTIKMLRFRLVRLVSRCVTLLEEKFKYIADAGISISDLKEMAAMEGKLS